MLPDDNAASDDRAGARGLPWEMAGAAEPFAGMLCDATGARS